MYKLENVQSPDILLELKMFFFSGIFGALTCKLLGVSEQTSLTSLSSINIRGPKYPYLGQNEICCIKVHKIPITLAVIDNIAFFRQGPK